MKSRITVLLGILLTVSALGYAPPSEVFPHNDANLRTRVTLGDGSYWVYQYDTLGQLKSGKKYWSDDTPVGGQQFEYNFDDIGNRTLAKAGGDQAGANLRSAAYSANLLNQLTNRTVPGAVDVLGSATNTATVTVNNQPTSRKGEYYRVEVAVNNQSGPAYAGLTNVGVLNNGPGANDIVTNQTGWVYLPKTPEVFKYDADGNLTNDGRWSLTWNTEHRLVTITGNTNVPSAARFKLELTYDYLGRRTTKKVSTWNGSSYAVQRTDKFLYDGWNLVAILDSQNTLLYSFTWGTDASGTMQEAGGVGGLLAMTVHSGALAGTYFYAYDGNYNVIALVNAADGSVAARYEYGPFGEVLRATGPLAKVNPFRFSTKFQDDETDWLYYGHRYYDASTGRWLSRDPIGESGGFNLYASVANSPVNKVDRLGFDAAIINHGGYTGHTSFVIIRPDGSLRAYHFYAKSHQTGRCCGLGSVLAVCCDSVSVWQQSANSLQDYLVSQQTLGGGVKIAAYAFGTSLDDQLSIEDLDEQDKADAGIYSLAVGIECHKKSWEWFNEYLEGGQQIYPMVLPGQPPPYFPERWFETRRHRQDSLPEISAPPSPATTR